MACLTVWGANEKKEQIFVHCCDNIKWYSAIKNSTAFPHKTKWKCHTIQQFHSGYIPTETESEYEQIFVHPNLYPYLQ